MIPYFAILFKYYLLLFVFKDKDIEAKNRKWHGYYREKICLKEPDVLKYVKK